MAGACLLLAAACGPGRDVVPTTKDERADAGGPGSDSYVYVARRPHGLIGLAEARGIDGDVARRAIDRLADDFDACAARRAGEGKLEPGAARVVAYVDAAGAVGAPLLKTSPGRETGSTALMCVAAPLRLMVFPPEDDAGAASRPRRWIAVEVEWSGRAAAPGVAAGVMSDGGDAGAEGGG